MNQSQNSGNSTTEALGRSGQKQWRLLRRLFSPFWVIPALSCLVAFGVGVGLPELDKAVAEYVPFLFPAGPDGARALLSTIAGAMISVTGLVFSITIVVLQLASSQFSPRVLRNFLNERVPQVTLGVFAASFVYALTVMRDVSGTVGDSAEKVPQLAVALAFLLVLTSVAMFLAFIHHITQAISVDTIIRSVGQETLELYRKTQHAANDQDRTPAEMAADHRQHQRVVVASSAGYLNFVNFAGLLDLARKRDAEIELLYPLGTFLVPEQPIALVRIARPDPSVDWSDEVGDLITIAWRRSMDQDVTFGLRQLVDIAERALSPGINDPTTAVQVINELHIVLREIVADDPVPGPWRDQDGHMRLLTAQWGMQEYLDLCVDEIAHWGASSLQIPRRLVQMLAQLEQAAHDDNKEALQLKSTQIDIIERKASEA